MQLGDLYRKSLTTMNAAGLSEAGSEVKTIFREILNIDAGQLLAHPEMEISGEDCARVEEIINRRLMREPLQYILGKWNFMGLDFYVEPNVLIPRPDTEVLVECTMKVLHDGMRILDLCTGTGCVLLSLLNYSNDCTGVGVDISPYALSLARKNADSIFENGDFPEKKHSVTIIESDLYNAVTGTFDIIVSNPPYINSDVIETLEPEVRDHEPRLALDGGTDGLDLIKRIIIESDGYLIPGGELLMEIGNDQGERVCELMKQAGFADVKCVKDYAGNDRVVHGRKPI